ncbi:hypothetical protein GCM10009853_023740 [Glycomyces scopariae]|uniref:Lipoprotein n=1 Tax=Glycomyces sambucus TaxID=380244 RepID=A0A1G9J367_9ACTN|nr:hypothetical protein [Glycomyces sambucus]SDL31889.1 hypothetical protein SAMN05216298_3389 [Glycomyces sambucus]
MTRKLTLIKGFAAVGAAGLLLSGCGGDELPGSSGNGDSDSDSSGSGSYSVMAEWDGCPALGDIQAIHDYMGVTDWGSNGLTSSDIPSGMDGEAFNCGAVLAELAVFHQDNEATADRDIPGTANIDVGVAPWDSDSEATENFQTRVEQLKTALETGGTEYSDVQEGEFEGDWDETYYYAGRSADGFLMDAIARKGDIVIYVFIDYSNDPAVVAGEDPVYPFTDQEFTDWVLNEYLPPTYADLLAKKENGL